MSSPVLWYATRSTGIVTLVLLTGTVVLGSLTGSRYSTWRWPGFAVQSLHRSLSLTASIFLVLHILTSVLDSFVHIGWAGIVVPFASGYKPLWVAFGALSFDIYVAVIVSSLLRHHIPARAWRSVHWAAYGCWPLAMTHAFGIGTDSVEPWVIGFGVACDACVALAGVLRLVTAIRSRNAATEVAPVLATTGTKHIRRQLRTRAYTREMI